MDAMSRWDLPPNASTGAAASALERNLKEYLETGIFSDLALVCGSRKFNVHKLVLATSSPVFKKMLSGGFMEAASRQGEIELKDDDPEALAALLLYFYTSAYPDLRTKSSTCMPFAAKVYAIADKYDARALQVLAVAKLKAICKVDNTPESIQNLIDTIDLVIDHNTPKDRALRDVLLSVVQANIVVLLASDHFRAYLIDNSELNFALLGMLEKGKGTPLDAFRDPRFFVAGQGGRPQRDRG